MEAQDPKDTGIVGGLPAQPLPQVPLDLPQNPPRSKRLSRRTVWLLLLGGGLLVAMLAFYLILYPSEGTVRERLDAGLPPGHKKLEIRSWSRWSGDLSFGLQYGEGSDLVEYSVLRRTVEGTDRVVVIAYPGGYTSSKRMEDGYSFLYADGQRVKKTPEPNAPPENHAIEVRAWEIARAAFNAY